MAREGMYSVAEDINDKAGYNQAGEIARILSNLRLTFTSAMIEQPSDLSYALETCRAVLNIISGKVKKELIEELDKKVRAIEDNLYLAQETYINSATKQRMFKNPAIRIKIKRDIESLWREIERTQDEYGYGMVSEDDSGL